MTARTAEVKINELIMSAKAVIKWRMGGGTRPNTTILAFPKDEGELLFQQAINGNPQVTLTFDPEKGKPIKLNMWMIRPVVSQNPNYMNLEFADTRWFLGYGHIVRSYNETTLAGNKRAVGTTSFGALQDIPEHILDIIKYQRSTIKPPRLNKQGVTQRAFNIVDMIEDVLEFAKSCGYPITYHLDVGTFQRVKGITLNNINIDGTIDSALDTLLSEVPGIGMFVDERGTIRFWDKTDGSEENIVKKFKENEEVGDSRIEFINNSLLAPSRVICQLSYRSEFRFDYSITTGSVVSSREVEPLNLINVLRCPDKKLKIPGKEPAYYGQWIPIDDALSAWNLLIGGKKQLTHENIQKFWFNDNMFEHWARIGQNKELDQNWYARIAALRASYRTHFQIPETWRGRLKEILPVLVSVVDAESGRPIDSPVYVKHCVELTHRGKKAQGGKAIERYKNITSWNADLKLAKPAQYVELHIADQARGVVTINFGGDDTGLYKTIRSEIQNPITYDPSDLTKPQFINQKVGQKSMRLSPNHDLSFVLTATPRANVSEALYNIHFGPNSSPFINQKNLMNPKGPVLYVRIPSSFMLVKLAWDDRKRDDIKSLCGIGKKLPKIEELIVNKDLVNAAAEAFVYRALYRFNSRLKGGASDYMDLYHPTGNIEEVTYSQEPRGRTRVRIDLSDEVRAPNFLSLIPARYREQLQGKVRVE